MGLVRTYSEKEVAAILKASEGQGVAAERGQGHSEGLHELVAVGRGREHTSEADLAERVLDERKKAVGAFDGCQAKAVTWALNTAAGQNALMYLNNSSVRFLFAEIDVANQFFQMKHIQAVVPRIGPIAKPVIQSSNVVYVAMKLMKEGTNLHIRTAFPMVAAPACGHSHCEITYVGNTSMDQDLTI